MPGVVKHIIAAIAFVACFAVCSAQGRLCWLESEHDYGTLHEDIGKAPVTFHAVNCGDSAIYITKVVTTCGCTTADYTHHEIAPGDTARVTLTYFTEGRLGSFSKQAYVSTNGVPQRYTLRLHGVVEGAPATVEKQYPYAIGALRTDARSILFGEMKRGKTKISYLRAYNDSPDSLKMEFFNVPQHITIDPSPRVVPPYGSCTVTAFFSSPQAPLWALNSHTVDVKAYSVNGSDTIATAQGTIDVMGYVEEDFSALTAEDMQVAPMVEFDSQTIDFGQLTHTSAPLTATLRITNSGQSDLLVRRIFTNNSAITVGGDTSTPIKPGKSREFSIEVSANLLTGKYLSESITIITNDPLRSKSQVRVVALMPLNNTP